MTAIIEIGGEGAVNGASSNKLYNFIGNSKPIIFALEHRFYGKSQPFRDYVDVADFSPESLEYHSSR